MLGGNTHPYQDIPKANQYVPDKQRGFLAKYRLSNEIIPAIICEFQNKPVKVIVTVVRRD